MNLSENIGSILHEQFDGYRLLLDILRRERECLMQFNPGGLETLSKEKDTIVLKLKLLEDERIRLVRAFAAERGIADDAVFKQLTETSNDNSFQNVRLQLISILQSITELNNFNRVLIERSSGVVKNALNFLVSAGVQLPNAHSGTRLSREI